ncbi:glycosyltransferase [Microbacterium sp. NPDC091313]
MMRRTPLIWCPGVAWDETAGTDRRLVEAVAADRAVCWIDPPHARGRAGAPVAGVDTEVAGVRRFGIAGPPALTRWPMRAVTDLRRRRLVADVVARTGAGTVVVANPLARFPRDARTRVLYVTDDWIAGAPLMRLPRAQIERTLGRNRDEADLVAVVSPALAADGADVVLPNGVDLAGSAIPARRRERVAGLIGQLNERLDLDALEALTDAGVPVRVVGARADRGGEFGRRLAAFLQHPLVDWRGAVPAADVPGHLAEIAVGLTPYADSAFNRASSPLKTYEYLAAGLPVVSTDLPASRWLASPHVVVAGTAGGFAAAVRRLVDAADSTAAADARRALAAEHSWQRRAADLLALIERAERGAALAGGVR